MTGIGRVAAVSGEGGVRRRRRGRGSGWGATAGPVRRFTSACPTADVATCGSTRRAAQRRGRPGRADRRLEVFIVPGLVDAHCHVGLDEHGGVDEPEQEAR